jgi:hypothetical protein
VAQVATTNGVADSAVIALQTLVNNNIALQAKLDAAIAANDPVAIAAAQAEIQQANADAKTHTDALAAAIAAIPAPPASAKR